jgi:two-component system KDP operon response regulator KdpE
VQQLTGIFHISNTCWLDLDRQTVHRGGKTLHLTDIEYRILLILVENYGQTVSAESLIAGIWVGHPTGNKDNLKTQISKIRKLIETDSSHPKHLFCVRGAGYILRIERK